MDGDRGRGVARDDGARAIAMTLGPNGRRRFVVLPPAIVEADPPLAVIAAGIVRTGAPAFEEARIGSGGGPPRQGAGLKQTKKKIKTKIIKLKNVRVSLRLGGGCNNARW